MADVGSLQRAAEAIGLSQPTLTHTLADLERLLEVELFQRHARGVRPTEAGHELVRVARRMLQAAVEVAENVAVRQSEGLARLHLAAPGPSMTGIVADVVPRFSAANPHIQLQVTEVDPSALGAMLSRREIDLAICREPAIVPQGWVYQRLLDDPFVVVCGLHHPLATRPRVVLADLRDQIWLAAPTGSRARQVHEWLVQSEGWAWHAHPVVTRVLAVTWSLLAKDPVLMLLPFSAVRQLVEAGQLAVLPVEQPLPGSALGLLTPGDDISPAAEVFAAFLHDVCTFEETPRAGPGRRGQTGR